MRETVKAIAAGLGAGVAYFIGVIPAEGGFGDLSTVQWLGVVPILLAVYGITWSIPDGRVSARRMSNPYPEDEPPPRGRRNSP